MVWKKSKFYQAWKTQSTEIMQKNNFSCYFSHTVCPDLSKYQTQMSWMIDHCFMEPLVWIWLAFTQPRNDTKCHMWWIRFSEKHKTHRNSIMKLFLLMISIHLTSVLNLVENNRKSIKVSDFWREILWKSSFIRYHLPLSFYLSFSWTHIWAISQFAIWWLPWMRYTKV